jgi:hypothetical protein
MGYVFQEASLFAHLSVVCMAVASAEDTRLTDHTVADESGIRSVCATTIRWNLTAAGLFSIAVRAK